MSRRRKSSASVRKSKDDTTGLDEWSEEERGRLSDALRRDEGENNWRWIARQVKTRTMTQVKEYVEKLNSEKHSTNTRSAARERQGHTASNKRPIAPRDDGPLEGWINATKRLRGDDDVDGTCIPQNQRSRVQEHKGTSNHKEQCLDGHRDDGDRQDDPVSNNNSYLGKENQKRDSLLEDVLTIQKQLMEKISLLDSKLENLRSDDTSSQSSVMDILIKINNRLNELDKSALHGCCGGPVIVQTTPHANVVHQPILDSCSSCSDAKQEKRHRSLMTVSNEGSVANKERNDPVSTHSLNRTSIHTTSDAGSTSTSKSSSNCPPTILVSDTQDGSLPKSQTVTSSTPSPESSSRLPNVPSTVESSTPVTKHGHPVINVPETNDNASVPPKQLLPDNNKEQFPVTEACTSVVKESGSLPSGTVRIVSVPSAVNQSPTIATTSNPKLVPVVSLAASREQRDPMSEHNNPSFTSSEQLFPQSCIKETGSSRVVPVQTTPVPSLQSSYIDLHSTLSSSPILSTVVRSPAAAAKYIPVVVTSESSHLRKQTTPMTNTISPNTSTPITKSNDHSSRIPLHSASTTASDQMSIPPGYITLSHTTNVSPPASTVHSTSPLQPQAVNPTPQSPSVLYPAAVGAALKKAANDVSGKKSAASSKDILNAAMLISNYVTEHPNREQQSQWQSCLSAIITDYHKNQDPSRGDLQQLVSIGYNPYVVVTQFELEEMLEKSRGRPKFFALRLAEKLYGIDVLVKSTPYGIGGKAALHPAILDAIKVEVLQRFAADMSSEAQTALWKGCVTSIAQRCKRARNPRKNRSSKRRSVDDDDDFRPPSMAIGGRMQRDECEQNEDSQGESDDEEDYELDQPIAKHMPPLVRCTPPLVRIPSDNEEESLQNSAQKVVLSIDRNAVHCVTQAKDSCARPESSASSSLEGSKDNEQDIPPGIDPDITVVHLPCSLESSVKPQTKQTEDQRPSPMSLRRNSVTAGCSDSSPDIRAEGSPKVAAGAVATVGAQEPCDHHNGSDSRDDESQAVKFHGDFLQIAQHIHKLHAGASPESIMVSGIQMTPDFSHVLIGGNPNIVIPRQKYLDALTKSSQPTHFAVRLAELAFGDDVLEASTVTGGKRGTMQLDPTVISAIQTEVISRFLKNVAPENHSIVWRKCVTSIATRCKTLRYNRSRTAENRWPAHPSQISTE